MPTLSPTPPPMMARPTAVGFCIMDVRIRSARPGDGADLARGWLDGCRYYAALDPERFQVPDDDGLAEWFEQLLARPRCRSTNGAWATGAPRSSSRNAWTAGANTVGCATITAPPGRGTTRHDDGPAAGPAARTRRRGGPTHPRRWGSRPHIRQARDVYRYEAEAPSKRDVRSDGSTGGSAAKQPLLFLEAA